MRIVIDMQGAQTESKFRGIGRYTTSLVNALIKNKGKHEIILALSNLFPDTIAPIHKEFGDKLPPNNICVWDAPGPIRASDFLNEERREVAELLREAFFAILQPDMILIISFFEGYVDDAVTSIARFDKTTPVSLVHHDLIPFLNQDHYLNNNESYKKFYMRKVENLKQAQLLFAVSDFSHQEVVDALDFDKIKVTTIFAASDSIFQSQLIDESARTQIQNKLGITRPFILYTGAADERKNLPRLIAAYAAMPKKIRSLHQLVFAGRMPDSEMARLKHYGESINLKPNELIFTGFISDNELVQLYSLCKLYVFPSWHEGFGLPVLEAMSCGAPVIAAKGSSLIEVVGLDDALFDPFDINNISSKILEVLSDDELRSRLIQHGLIQAQKFSWDITANHVIKAWERDIKTYKSTPIAWQPTAQKIVEINNKLTTTIASVLMPNKYDFFLKRIAASIDKNQQNILSCMRSIGLPELLTWRVEGPFDSSYSLALLNREVAKALASLNHNVLLHSTEGPGDFLPDETFLLKNPELAEMHRRSISVLQCNSDVASRNLYPPRVADMKARFNFLHTYGWEESGFPLEWVDDFNYSLQGMTVVSNHVRKIMIDHGVTIPVMVSSLGVDHWKRIKPCDSLNIDSCKKFRFLHVSSCFPRKGVDVMLRAYGKAFRFTDDVILIIKTFPNPHNETHALLNSAKASDPNFPEVLIIEEDYSDEQLKALYMQCSVLVAPSRAEGFGLPMAEAMVSNLAVITTGWGGQVDFCNNDTSWLIDYSFKPADTHFNLTTSVWAEPDEKHLALLMKELYHMPEEERQKKIYKAEQHITKHFKWNHVASRMVNLVHKCSGQIKNKEPRVGWITPWNTRCGIASYSEHLIKNIPSHIHILAAHSDLRTSDDSQNVHRCWNIGEEDNLHFLSNIIDSNEIDVLVVQFNYGFFNFNSFLDFVDYHINCGRKVIMVLHATIDPENQQHKKLSFLASALKKCHRILVHSYKDMNRLKQIEIINNVTFFPHGILDFEVPLPQEKDNKAPYTIASYGYFLPHKGLLELIEAMSLLREKQISIKLLMLNAEYPVNESKNIIEMAKNKITELNLQSEISLHTVYTSDEESLEKLSHVDLVIFPYQQTGESSSAAVRYGIASGRPVAVTPLEIFDDVKSAVHFLSGLSSIDIADSLFEFISKMNKSRMKKSLVELNAAKWKKENSYSRVSLRLWQMLLAMHSSEMELEYAS